MGIAYIALLTFSASIIGTISGFGVSTIMVPVLAFFFPFSIVLLFVAIPQKRFRKIIAAFMGLSGMYFLT